MPRVKSYLGLRKAREQPESAVLDLHYIIKIYMYLLCAMGTFHLVPGYQLRVPGNVCVPGHTNTGNI